MKNQKFGNNFNLSKKSRSGEKSGFFVLHQEFYMVKFVEGDKNGKFVQQC